MCCLNPLSVGVRMDPWNDWQELPACSNSLESCSVALQPITNEMSVYQKQPANTCLNYPCSTDAEIQCQLLNVLGTGTCNNDGVHFFFLTNVEFWLLLTSLLCDAPQNGWKGCGTPSSCLTFSVCGGVLLNFGFFALSLGKQHCTWNLPVTHAGHGKKIAKLDKNYICRKTYPCLALGKYNRNLKSKLIFSKMIKEFTWMAM